MGNFILTDDNKNLLTQEPAIWCSNACPGAEAHKILSFISDRFQENKGNGGLCSQGWQELDKKLPDLSTILFKTKCPRLNAHSIHVCKESAFLDIENGSTFITQLYQVICNAWNNGHTNGNTLGSIDDLLDGWIHDLPLVRKQSLSIYLQILACDNLIDNPKFTKALESLENFLSNNLANNPGLIDDCGEQLIAYVFESFLDINPQMIMENISIAFKIALLQANDSNLKSIKALRQLIDHLIKKTAQKRGKKNNIYRYLNLTDNCKILSKAFDRARESEQFNLCRELEGLIPLVGNWKKRKRHLKLPKGSMKLHISGEYFDSVTKDTDNKGLHYHVCFDNIIEASVVKGSKRTVNPTQKCPIEIIDLYVKNKKGSVCLVKEADAVFTFEGEEITTKVYPIRGWKYKKSNQGHAGAVFRIAKPPIKKNDLKKLEALTIGEGEAEDDDYIDIPNKSKWQAMRFDRNRLDYDTPFDPGPEGLVKGIEEFFKVLSDKIHFKKWSHLFWTTKLPKIPKNELEIDITLRPLFQDYVESRSGKLTCQEDSGLGLCDYVVSRESDNIVIELKSSMHKKLKQGIEAELPTLMKSMNTKFGVFLLFDFKAAYEKNTDKLNNLIKLRNNISKTIDLNIHIMIVNCDKPKTASKIKKAARHGDGFQSH